jgi:hypothetical protein
MELADTMDMRIDALAAHPAEDEARIRHPRDKNASALEGRSSQYPTRTRIERIVLDLIKKSDLHANGCCYLMDTTRYVGLGIGKPIWMRSSKS